MGRSGSEGMEPLPDLVLSAAAMRVALAASTAFMTPAVSPVDMPVVAVALLPLGFPFHPP